MKLLTQYTPSGLRLMNPEQLMDEILVNAYRGLKQAYASVLLGLAVCQLPYLIIGRNLPRKKKKAFKKTTLSAKNGLEIASKELEMRLVLWNIRHN